MRFFCFRRLFSSFLPERGAALRRPLLRTEELARLLRMCIWHL